MRKSRLSQERRQARKALVELLNLPDLDFRGPDDDPRGGPAFVMAMKFIDTHGPLTPTYDKDDPFASAELFEYARRFRQVWTNAKKGDFRSAEAVLTQILTEGEPIKGQSPTLTADIEFGAIRQQAKTQLQRLALELLYSRRALKRCAACRDYFIAEGSSRQRYCKNVLRDCAHQSRNKSQRLLMRKRRAKPEENNE